MSKELEHTRWTKELEAYRDRNGRSVPISGRETLALYLSHGMPPGSFIEAVLCNNLRNAMSRADGENLSALYTYVAFLTNRAPANCWGSVEKVNEWIDSHH